jgi:chromosome segregation ATPase
MEGTMGEKKTVVNVNTCLKSAVFNALTAWQKVRNEDARVDTLTVPEPQRLSLTFALDEANTTIHLLEMRCRYARASHQWLSYKKEESAGAAASLAEGITDVAIRISLADAKKERQALRGLKKSLQEAKRRCRAEFTEAGKSIATLREEILESLEMLSRLRKFRAGVKKQLSAMEVEPALDVSSDGSQCDGLSKAA